MAKYMLTRLKEKQIKIESGDSDTVYKSLLNILTGVLPPYMAVLRLKCSFNVFFIHLSYSFKCAWYEIMS